MRKVPCPQAVVQFSLKQSIFDLTYTTSPRLRRRHTPIRSMMFTVAITFYMRSAQAIPTIGVFSGERMFNITRDQQKKRYQNASALPQATPHVRQPA